MHASSYGSEVKGLKKRQTDKLEHIVSYRAEQFEVRMPIHA